MISPNQLSPALSTVNDVARIAVLGGEEEEYRVNVDPVRMRAHNLTILDVVKALTASNVLVAVGRLEERDRLYLVLSNSRFASPDQIGHTILKHGSDGIVELEDVATVELLISPYGHGSPPTERSRFSCRSISSPVPAQLRSEPS